MAATIKIKNSSTTGSAPSAGSLVQGELAVNVTDQGLYTKNASGTVVKLNAPSIDDKNTGATKYLTIDTSGNVGLSVTPSAWVSTWRALDISTYTSVYGANGNTSGLSQNAYYNGTNWIYRNTNAASNYIQSGGQHEWHRAGSGTAGNPISFTQAMTLDASGNLGVGTTSPGVRIESSGAAAGSSFNALRLGNTDTTASSPVTMLFLSADDGTARNRATIASAADGSNNGYLSFSTRSSGSITEKARIDSSGNLLVGTTSSSATSGYIQTISSGSKNAWVNKSSVSGTHWIASFNNVADTQVGSITANNANTTYATSSDYRLKNTIVPMTGALAKVSLLKPVTYKWNIDNSDGEGFIAHELAEVCPNAVVGEKDAIETYTDNEGVEQTRPKYQGIDTSFLVATLTAAIQELKAEVDSLKAQIAGA